ncbi:hypothetical protein LCGC14_1331470, partial [marine sediment metagenome]
MGDTVMPLSWREVIDNDEYKALTVSEQAKLKVNYFNELVSPSIEASNIGNARNEFFNFTKQLEIEKEKPSFIKEVIGKSLLKLPQRVAGMALGAMNTPLAFIWGSQTAREQDPKEFNKMPTWKQALVSTGAGLESAYRSAFKEGDWGTLYGDYYKSVKGKTIEEDLPESLKWVAPTIEFLANIVTDPLVVGSTARQLLKFKLPKNWVGKIPKSVERDLNQIAKLEQSEIRELQNRMTDIFKGRTGYMKKWQDTVAFTEQQYKIKQGQVIEQRMKIGEPLLRDKPFIPGEQMTAPRQAMVGQPKREFAEVIPREEVALTRELRTTPKFGKKGVSPQAIAGREKANVFRTKHGLEPLGEVPTAELQTERTRKAVKEVEAFRKAKGLPPLTKTTTVKATGGAILGIEEDKDGNISYNPKKGLAGVGLALGGKRVFSYAKNKKALATLKNNPAWAKVVSGIGKENKIFSLPGIIANMNVKLFDRFGKLKQHSTKAYEAARVHNSYKDQAMLKFRVLKDAFKDVKKDDFTITSYIKAHRDVTRLERGIKSPVGEGYTPLTLDDVRQSIKEIETNWVAKGKDIDDLRGALDSWNQWTHDYILSEAWESGIISKAQYDDIVKNNKFYATYDVLKYLPENIHDIPMLPSKEYYSMINQDVIHKMKGTEKLIDDPIEATIRKFTNAQSTFARNKVASIFVEDPNVQKIIKPIAMSKKEFGIMKNQGLDPVMNGSWNKKEFGTINRFKEGNVERYMVPIEIAEAMKQLTPYQAPRVVQAYNAIFRAAATTLRIPFMIRNMFRDAFMAYISSPVYKTRDIAGKFQKDWMKGAWEATKFEFLGKPSLVEDYVKSGGGFGYVGAEA